MVCWIILTSSSKLGLDFQLIDQWRSLKGKVILTHFLNTVVWLRPSHWNFFYVLHYLEKIMQVNCKYSFIDPNPLIINTVFISPICSGNSICLPSWRLQNRDGKWMIWLLRMIGSLIVCLNYVLFTYVDFGLDREHTIYDLFSVPQSTHQRFPEHDVTSKDD